MEEPIEKGMKEEAVIALMKARGATKEEIDQMNLYFNKYCLDDEIYSQVYKDLQRTTIDEKRGRVEAVKRLDILEKQVETMAKYLNNAFEYISKLEDCVIVLQKYVVHELEEKKKQMGD